MEGKNDSVSRRTRFLDNKIIFQGATIGAHDLHDSTPDLGKNEIMKNSEHTLTELTDEWNDLRRKMSLLKDSLKVKRNTIGKRNWSAQSTEISNLTDVLGAKRVINDCIAELTLANNYLDGNEETAAVNSEKLQGLVIGKDCKNVAIVIEGLSITRIDPMTRGENLVADSAIGASENFFNEHRKEAAMQTEASDVLTDRNITKSASPRRIDETDEKSRRHRKKKRKWFSSCCTKREKKSNEKMEKLKKSNRTIGKDEKSTSGRVVICEDDS